MLVIYFSCGYHLLLMVTYRMSSAYYALVLGDRSFLNLLFYQIFLFHLYLRNNLNRGLTLNVTVKPLFKLFQLVFMKFRKLRSFCKKKKKKSLISIKLWYFHSLSHCLFYWPLQLNKSHLQKIDLYKRSLISRGTRLIDINYLRLCNALLELDVFVVIHNLFYYIKFGKV